MPFALAACLLELPSAGAEIQLLPAGPFRAVDGRPADAPHWVLTPTAAAALSAKIEGFKTPRVIDYEHQTLYVEHNGQPAPAAGWFHRIEARDSGLYALNVEWTARAKTLIDAREYRFISPVFTYATGSGEIQDILHAALTNTPALDGLAAVSARFSTLFPEVCSMHESLLEQLRYLLNLPVTTTAEEMGAELQKLIDQLNATPPDATTQTRLSLPDWIVALKAAPPDPAQYVPVAALTAVQNELAALKTQQAGAEVDALLHAALQDGRLLPPLETWARELGAKDLAALRAYLDNAPPLAALQGMQTGGKSPAVAQDPSARFAADAALQAEFGTAERYQAFERAAAAGRVHITGSKT